MKVVKLPNGELARIVEELEDGYIVSNLNMPFYGTLCNVFVPKDSAEVV